MVSSGAYHFATGDGPQTAQAKGFERGFSSLTGVASNKAANWGNIGELELLSSAGRNIQGSHLPSGACMTFSNGLGGFSVGPGVENREGHIVSYLPGSNVQGETMQTLHLMNPHYAGYTDTASQAGNVVLVNPSAIVGGQDNPAGNNSQLQQHYIGYSVSPSLTQSSMAQQPTLSTMYNSALVAQPNTPPSSLFANRFGHWAAGNELSFLPLNDATRITQPLAARLACMEPGQQQPTSNISQLNMRQHLSLHDEQASMLQNGVALGLNMDNSQASCGPNQGLSLSLSAQQYPLQMQYYRMQPDESGISGCQGLLHGAAEESSRDDGYPQKWVGNLSQFRTSSHDGSIGRGYQNAGSDLANRQIQAEASVQTVVGFRGLLTGSKYLKAAQLLLEEVVSLGCGMKNNSSKHSKLQSWMTPSSRMDGSSPKDGSLVAETMSTAKEGVACITSAPSIASGPEQKTSVVAERTPQENQELQMKKAKLMAMLDEVDRRYKQYFSQMEAVISSFESAAGLGAAKTYTALALQTISKHFRGLRDAIGGQIRAASRALGEEDTSSLGLGRLRYVDQQLRQQRALQQLGIMQQHAWRPQRGLPERSVSVLRAWLFEHFLHPYPKDADKHMLARQTGLSRNQVSNWFINARVRLWKPMVEEMYLEEIKEAEIDRTSTDQKSNTENSDNLRSNITGMDDQGGVGIPDNGNKQGRDEAGSKDAGMMLADKQMVLGYQHGGSNNILQQAAALDGADTHLFQGIKKARNADVLDSYTQEFKSEDIGRDEEFENEDKHGFTMRGIDHAFGGYHDEGEGFSAVPAGYNGVSLTLGLQHSDGLSLAGAQQQQYYLQQQQQQQLQLQGRGGGLLHHFAMAGSRRRLEEVEDYYSSIDSAKNYEALAELQTRKRFASHILHET